MNNEERMVKQFINEQQNYHDFISYLENLLRNLIKESSIDYHSIAGRTKEVDSLRGKLRKGSHKYRQLEDVTDLIGMRIITHFASDVSLIASLIEQEFSVDHKNSVDKRKQMEVNQFGYMSLHYVIELTDNRLTLGENQKFKGMKAEVQIRSMLQHAWAEIEHDLGYKIEKQVPWDVRRSFSRVASLLETADLEFDQIRERMDDYEDELLEEIRANPERVKVNKENLELYTKMEDGGIAYTRYLQLPSTADVDSSYYYHLDKILDFVKIKDIGSLEKELELHKDKMRAFAALVQTDACHFVELLCLFIVSREKSPRYIQYYYENFMYEQLSTNDIIQMFTVIDVIEAEQ